MRSDHGPDLATAVITAHCPETLPAFGIMIGYDASIHEGKDAAPGKGHHLGRIRAHFGDVSPAAVALIDDSVGVLAHAAATGHFTVPVRNPDMGFRLDDAIVALAST